MHPYQFQDMVLFLSSWMIYAIQDLLLLKEYCLLHVIEGSTIIPSVTNRYPIVDILCLISVDRVFNRLSNVRLLGIDTRPQAIASLWLYKQFMLRKICNALLESILNHILTIKHLTITVGEYTYGLPRFLFAVGQGMQPISIQNVKEYGFLYSIRR